jgi:hypothetical protein
MRKNIADIVAYKNPHIGSPIKVSDKDNPIVNPTARDEKNQSPRNLDLSIDRCLIFSRSVAPLIIPHPRPSYYLASQQRQYRKPGMIPNIDHTLFRSHGYYIHASDRSNEIRFYH